MNTLHMDQGDVNSLNQGTINGDDWVQLPLNKRLKIGFEKKMNCDVEFIVGDKKELIPAHKFELASGSPVFNAMFNGDLAEDGKIVVPDIEPNVFRVILEYLYTDELNLREDNALAVL